MAKVSFTVRQGNKKSATIQLSFNYGTNKRLRYSTGLMVSDIKNWDAGKMRIKNVVAEVHKNDVNNKLTDIQLFVERTYIRLAITDGVQVKNEILKMELNDFLNKRSKAEDIFKTLELLPFYHWYINNYQKNPLVTTGKPMSAGTAKTYRNGYTILKRFNDTIFPVTYENISIAFYDSFLNFLYDSNYSLNYVGTQIKILKTIMNAAFEKDFHSNLDFKKNYFKQPKEEVFNIYLNQNELNKILKLDVSNFQPKKVNNDFVITCDKLDRARDLFLISANTGLRVSDFNNLTQKNIIESNGGSYISIITQKNNKRLTIPD